MRYMAGTMFFVMATLADAQAFCNLKVRMDMYILIRKVDTMI